MIPAGQSCLAGRAGGEDGVKMADEEGVKCEGIRGEGVGGGGGLIYILIVSVS